VYDSIPQEKCLDLRFQWATVGISKRDPGFMFEWALICDDDNTGAIQVRAKQR
jgi:hypothetical protein